MPADASTAQVSNGTGKSPGSIPFIEHLGNIDGAGDGGRDGNMVGVFVGAFDAIGVGLFDFVGILDGATLGF